MKDLDRNTEQKESLMHRVIFEESLICACQIQ